MEDTTDLTIWQQILQVLLPFLFTILSIAGSYAVVLLRRWVTKHSTLVDADLAASTEEMLRNLVRNAIFGAEEMAARAARVDSSAENRMDSAIKLQWVIDRVTKQWPGKLPVELEAIIHEELAKIMGAGATGRDISE